MARNKVTYYTGYPSLQSLNACYRFLGPAVDNLIYWNGGKSEIKGEFKGRGRPRALTPLEEFFMVLVRLRLGLFEDLVD